MVGVWISYLPHIEKGWYYMACGLSMMICKPILHVLTVIGRNFVRDPRLIIKCVTALGRRRGYRWSVPNTEGEIGGYTSKIWTNYAPADIHSTQKMLSMEI